MRRDVDGHPRSGLVNIGGTLSVIIRKLYRQLRNTVTPTVECVLQGTASSLLNILGSCTARVTIRETSFLLF